MQERDLHNASCADLYDRVKTEVVQAARSFFHRDLESVIIRPLACIMGYIPPNLDILSLNASDVAPLIDSPSSLEFLQDAFYIEHGRPYIKGTRTLSPVTEPWCKYTALFDSRPEFDSLRLLFLVAADPS